MSGFPETSSSSSFRNSSYDSYHRGSGSSGNQTPDHSSDSERNWRGGGGGGGGGSERDSGGRRYSDDHEDSGDSYRSSSRYRDRSPRDRRSEERRPREERRRRRRRSRDSSRDRSYSRGRYSPRDDSDSDRERDRDRYSRDRYYEDRRRHRSRDSDYSERHSRSTDRFVARVRDEWLAHVWGDGNRPDGVMDMGEPPMEHYDRSSYKSQVPNKTLIIRGLGPYITEKHIRDEVIKSGGSPRDIRLIRKKDTGSSRGFAFVEFGSTEEARGVVEKCDGEFRLQEQKVIMQYSIQRDFDKEVSADWYCKCCALNFKRREFCYRCGSDRKTGECSDSEEGSSHPTHTVMLKGLDMLTTEENVLKAIQTLSSLPIRSVRIGRDKVTNLSRGICYLEMNNVSDAMYLHNTLLTERLRIDGRSAYVSYCKNIPVFSTVSQGTASNAGNAAIAAAQWSHQKSDLAQYTINDVPRLAEYSASVYAKNAAEREAYVKHYTEYYTKIMNEGGTIPQTEGMGSNPASTGFQDPAATPAAAATAAAAADPNVNATQANPTLSRAPVTEPPAGAGERCYPVPDVSTYQYDKTSGYYYDPFTTLYYDANSQYYFNSKINKFLYWDGTKSTYLLAPTGDNGQPNMQNMAAAAAAADNKTEEEKKKDKQDDKDKVKVAKRIAKDMEKWAKTLNQKKEIAKQNLIATQTVPVLKAQGAADIGYTVGVLGKKDSSPSVLSPYASMPPSADSLVAEYGQGSDSEEDSEEIMQEDKLVDWSKIACLLCKRQFPTKEALLKHQQLSDLHKQNLEAWYRSMGVDREDASRKSVQYRDRAKERRLKYNEPDVPPTNKLKENYMKAREATVNYEQPTKTKIGGENVGNKLLQKMGWQEGMGLGKKNQGRTDIIQAKARPATAGLGIRTMGVTPGPGETYKDCVKKMMRARYEEVDNR